jgi:hypothetical protein
MPASQPAPVRASWQPHLALGITGHRASNPSYSAHAGAIAAALEALFAQIDTIAAALPGTRGAVRLHSLLVDGTDQIAAERALARGWELAVPLPFGAALNCAINAHPGTLADVDALLAGCAASDPAVEAKAAAIRQVTSQARLFELADRDTEIEALWRATIAAPDDRAAAKAFEALASDNVALAGRVMIERVDLVVAVWDGKIANLPGGTGHTVVAALAMGAPVLLIDPARPATWRILNRPEELAQPVAPDAAPDFARLEAIIRAAVVVDGWSPALLAEEKWRPYSSRLFGLYRPIERVFGGGAWFGSLRVAYEAPDAIVAGSGAAMVAAAHAMPGGDERVARELAADVLPLYAWADGVASRLADAYRSGMSVNFVLAALAVMVGILYLPAGMAEEKWGFAAVELLLLGGILALTAEGSRLGWHRRWFAMRRVAEYLRHAPALLLLGVARPTGRWPRAGGDGGTGHDAEGWPEHFARHALRDVGLPRVAVTRDYLRAGLAGAVLPHVTGQVAYHDAKAQRLERVHHRLDKVAETCFALAVVSVMAYLGLKGAGALGWVPKALAQQLSPLFTFCGVAFPTLGANLSGIRYFGDFERFGAISRVAAEKLRAIETRTQLLLSGAPEALTYAATADLVHALDEAVVEEIASWQAVFGAKHLALPA